MPYRTLNISDISKRERVVDSTVAILPAQNEYMPMTQGIDHLFCIRGIADCEVTILNPPKIEVAVMSGEVGVYVLIRAEEGDPPLGFKVHRPTDRVQVANWSERTELRIRQRWVE